MYQIAGQDEVEMYSLFQKQVSSEPADVRQVRQREI